MKTAVTKVLNRDIAMKYQPCLIRSSRNGSSNYLLTL